MTNNVIRNNICGGVNITDFDSPNDGSFALFQGVFSGNTFDNNDQGIFYGANADVCNIAIRNNSFSGNLTTAIYVKAGDAGSMLIKQSKIEIDSNQINNTIGDAITISPAGDTISINLTNNKIVDNGGSAFVSYFSSIEEPIADLVVLNNELASNLNENYNASGGISFDLFKSVNARIENNIFRSNISGNSIGKYSTYGTMTSTVQLLNNQFIEDSFDFYFWGNAPEYGCFTVTGNVGTIDPTYNYYNSGSGQAYIVPCTYSTENTGGFNFYIITPAVDCSGTSCP